MISLIKQNTISVLSVAQNLADVSLLVTTSDWAPGQFRDGYRKLANFERALVIGLDIDGGCSLEDALELFAPFAHIIATTRNHLKEKNGVVAARFRVLLRLDRAITRPEDYKATYMALCAQYPFLDEACSDASRMFYKSDKVVSIQEQGRVVKVVEAPRKGKLARTTKEFLKAGAPEGQWNANLFKAAKDLQQNNYSLEEAKEYLSEVTGHLDGKDARSLQSAFATEPKHAPRLGEVGVIEWVADWLNTNSVTMKYNEALFYNGIAVTFDELEDKLLLDTARSSFKFNDKHLFAALRLWHKNEPRRIKEVYAENIAFDGCQNNLPEKLVETWEGRENPLTSAVLRHFLWSVKRKLCGLDVTYHLMPILVGKTGGGKSQAVIRLLAPINELTVRKDLDIVNDERQRFNFSKYFVVFFDEMAKASRTDVEALKAIITDPFITYRILGRNENSSKLNAATCIGASNHPVQDIINDPTSARRYYQVDCADQLNWDAINSFDYVGLWKGIDERAEAPIKPHLAELKIAQEKIRSRSDFEHWLNYKVKLGTGETSIGQAYESYTSFCKLQGIRFYMSQHKFQRELGKVSEKGKTNKQRFYLLTLITEEDGHEYPAT